MWSRWRIVSLSAVTLVVVLLVLAIVWNPFEPSISTPRNASQENQILFVGPGFNDTSAARNSTIVGSFRVNMTTAGLMQFMLGDEKYYYLPDSVGNITMVPSGQPVHTFQSGYIEVNGDIFNLVSSKPCTASIVSTQTNGSTVIAYATCNSATTPAVITTGFIHLSTAGIWQFDYTLNVPSNATIGTYLVDILIQNASEQNFANLSNNLVYILTVNVTE